MIFLKKMLDSGNKIADDMRIKIKGRSRPECSLKGNGNRRALNFIINPKKGNKMKSKVVNTNARLSDGKSVMVKSTIKVPSTLDELRVLAADALETKDESVIDSHLTDLFVSWCVAHTFQSQVRSKVKTASPSLTNEQLAELVNEISFRIPRPASAPRGDKVTIKKSQLTPEQIAKLREMGIL